MKQGRDECVADSQSEKRESMERPHVASFNEDTFTQ